MARTNRLIESAASGSGRPGFVTVGEHQVPTDIAGYCDWLNERGARSGMRWALVRGPDGKRAVARIDGAQSSTYVPQEEAA